MPGVYDNVKSFDNWLESTINQEMGIQQGGGMQIGTQKVRQAAMRRRQKPLPVNIPKNQVKGFFKGGGV